MNEYVMMFDSLQEGIIVVERAQEISFMNEISNKIFSKITGMVDFFNN
jgi:sensor histidine kinase regulating citrate/malate metabolism